MIGKSFSFLCNTDTSWNNNSVRSVYNIITETVQEFKYITDKIDNELTIGTDLSTLDALMESQDNFNIIQSLYSNLHKQYAFKRNMDVSAIEFTDSMDSLLGNVYAELMYDGPTHQITGILLKLLCIEIGRNVTNFHKTSCARIKIYIFCAFLYIPYSL